MIQKIRNLPHRIDLIDELNIIVRLRFPLHFLQAVAIVAADESSLFVQDYT
jgi:hypothetical protein